MIRGLPQLLMAQYAARRLSWSRRASAGRVPAILLSGGVLALINAGNPDWSFLSVLTGLRGLLITTCGGAFALHSNRARKHLTGQADRIHKNIESDQAFSLARSLIEQVEDPQLRDRLESFTALHILGITPEPSEVTERLLSPPTGASEQSQ